MTAVAAVVVGLLVLDCWVRSRVAGRAVAALLDCAARSRGRCVCVWCWSAPLVWRAEVVRLAEVSEVRHSSGAR